MFAAAVVDSSGWDLVAPAEGATSINVSAGERYRVCCVYACVYEDMFVYVYVYVYVVGFYLKAVYAPSGDANLSKMTRSCLLHICILTGLGIQTAILYIAHESTPPERGELQFFTQTRIKIIKI